MIKAYLVDDEPLARDRMRRMLTTTGRVQIVGASTDPVEAVDEICILRPQLLFLDIHMPGLTGFELLSQLKEQPLVVFTTAYDAHALEAFRVNSIDYLLKPVTEEGLSRALDRATRMLGAPEPRGDLQALLAQLGSVLNQKKNWLERVASRTGDKLELVETSRVTHFYAGDKLTYAATAERDYMIDLTIADLEARLDPGRFVRIHRSTIVNLDFLQELHSWFGGKMVARLKDAKKTELQVSRDRARVLRERLGG